MTKRFEVQCQLATTSAGVKDRGVQRRPPSWKLFQHLSSNDSAPSEGKQDHRYNVLEPWARAHAKKFWMRAQLQNIDLVNGQDLCLCFMTGENSTPDCL